MSFTSLDLIASIERRAFIPENQETFSQTEILSMADEEIKSNFIPRIVAAREEFYVNKTTFQITAGQNAYRVPDRAAGMIIREVKLLRDTNTVINLPRIEPEDVTTRTSSQVESFYMQDDSIILYPTPSSSVDTLEVAFFVEPGRLINPSSASVISAIDTATSTVTVQTIPAAWVTGNIFDFVNSKGMHNYKAIDYTSTGVSGTNITFASLPSTLQAGDYVTLEDTSPLVQLPQTFRPVLAQAVAHLMLESQNQPGAEKTKSKMEDMMEAAINLITPRVHGEQRVMKPTLWF